MRRFIVRLGQIFMVVLLANGMLWNLPVMAGTYTVKMGSDSGALVFEPNSLAVNSGDTITWINNKSSPHNFVFDKQKVAPELVTLVNTLSHKQLSMKPNEENAVTIPADLPAGTYDYYCEPHRGAGMAGKITVQ